MSKKETKFKQSNFPNKKNNNNNPLPTYGRKGRISVGGKDPKRTPPLRYGRGAKINLNSAFRNLSLSQSRLIIICILLSLPYIGVAIATYLAGLQLVTLVMGIIVLFIAGVIMFLRWFDQSGF